jgi:hypothetical protein
LWSRLSAQRYPSLSFRILHILRGKTLKFNISDPSIKIQTSKRGKYSSKKKKNLDSLPSAKFLLLRSNLNKSVILSAANSKDFAA